MKFLTIPALCACLALGGTVSCRFLPTRIDATDERVAGTNSGDALPESDLGASSEAEGNSAYYGAWVASANADNVASKIVSAIDAFEVDWKKGVRVVDLERGDSSMPWEHRSYDLLTAYSVRAGYLLWARDLFVLGVSDQGDSVLEQWYFTPETGGWTSFVNKPGIPIGNPAPAVPVVHKALVGGQFVPFSARVIQNRPRRKELYRGSSPTISAVTFDLDGRFLLFTGGNSAGLFLLDLSSTSPAPSVVFSELQFPEVSLVESLSPLLHKQLGRCYLAEYSVYGPGETDLALIWDYDNDGIPDNYESLSWDAYIASYPDSDWDLTVLPWIEMVD